MNNSSEMDLQALVDQLPGMIGDCIWRHLKKAKDVDVKDKPMVLKGELSIDLSSAVVTLPLNHAFHHDDSPELDTEESAIKVEQPSQEDDDAEMGADDTAEDIDDESITELEELDDSSNDALGLFGSPTTTRSGRKVNLPKKLKDAVPLGLKPRNTLKGKEGEVSPSKASPDSLHGDEALGVVLLRVRNGVEERIYKCNICHKTYKKKSGLKDHMFSHTRKSDYVCTLCDTPFLRQNKLDRHMASVHKAEVSRKSTRILAKKVSVTNSNQCDECERVFKRKDMLKRHMERVHKKKMEDEEEGVDEEEIADSDVKTASDQEHEEEKEMAMNQENQETTDKAEPHQDEAIKDEEANKEDKMDEGEQDEAEDAEDDSPTEMEKSETEETEAATKGDSPPKKKLRKTKDKDAESTSTGDLVCHICNKKFGKSGTLKEHLFTHKRHAKFQCDVCNLLCPTQARLNRHKRRTHGIGPPDEDVIMYKCEICNDYFSNNAELRAHLRLTHPDFLPESALPRKEETPQWPQVHVYHDPVNLQCPYCVTKTTSYEELKEHMTADHSSIPDEWKPVEGCIVLEIQAAIDSEKGDYATVQTVMFSCNICKNFIGERESAEEHMKTHIDAMPLDCQYCDHRCTHKESLRTHLVLVHNAIRILECELCPKMFTSTYGYSFHKKAEHKDDKVSLNGMQCEHCGKSFPKKSRLDDHIWIEHDKKELPFKCPHCPKRFIRQYRLKEHMFKHDKLTGGYMCETCGKVFRRPHALATHRHKDDPWKCKVCSAEFTSLVGYKTHMKKHTHPPGFMCRFCGLGFHTKICMENHERAKHTGEKPFACEVCDARFANKNSYNVHKESHNDPIPCSLCDRSFPTAKHLARHMNIHAPGRVYLKCDLCNKSFQTRRSLKKHIDKAHSEQAIAEQTIVDQAIVETYKEEETEEETVTVLQQETEIVYQCRGCGEIHGTPEECLVCLNSHGDLDMAEGTEPIQGEICTLTTGAEHANLETGEVLVIRLEN